MFKKKKKENKIWSIQEMTKESTSTNINIKIVSAPQKNNYFVELDHQHN